VRPARSPQAALPSTPTRGKPSGGEASRTTDLPSVTPPSIALSLPATVGGVELLPAEVLADLRDRLAEGAEKVDFGEYASAHRVYVSLRERITNLSNRYTGTQALPALQREVEQAAQRALTSCAAENAVIRKRNGKPLQCE
jgi:hypothetical protein